LRERKIDILLLANYFLDMKSSVKARKKLSTASEEFLLNYDFPGNIRELDHIIERAIIFAEQDEIQPEDLNLPRTKIRNLPTNLANEDNGADENVVLSMDEIEKWHIAKALRINRWDRTQTANQLGISPKTLYTKIKKYEIKQD
jgi:DNA-binding NtrC family response regulator